MGISIDMARALMQEGARRKFEGKIITLGVQDIFLDAGTFTSILNEFQVNPRLKLELSAKPSLSKDGFISDASFFKSIGFNDLLRLDATDYEGADIIFDLNRKMQLLGGADVKDGPRSALGEVDVVLNGGTLEHVFNVPVVLENIFKMLKIGGRVIHVAPCSNHIDHGFYMFSPTFFSDYLVANKFELNEFKIVKYYPDTSRRWETLDYVPGTLTGISMGGADNAMYATYIVATKQSSSTWDVVPQQGMYAENLWKLSEELNQKCPRDAIDFNDGERQLDKIRQFFNPASADLAIKFMNEALVKKTKSDDAVSYRKARKYILDAISARGDMTLMYSHCVQLSLAMMEFEEALRYATIVAALLPHDVAAQGQLNMVKEKMSHSR
jgi:SAM-dependent methyltransferase